MKLTKRVKTMMKIYEVIKDNELFCKTGWDKWNYHKIAELAGLHRDSVYRYLSKFDSAEDFKTYIDAFGEDNAELESAHRKNVKIYLSGYSSNSDYSLQDYLKACERCKTRGTMEYVHLDKMRREHGHIA